ncbi:MAG: PLP-dependent transferase [Firmicutes bacterium]|nr:PLP-dependent transferase [Bacillota bacterium]
MKITIDMGFGTKAIHAGNRRNLYGSMGTPIVPAVTYEFDGIDEAEAVFFGHTPGYAYSRGGNPTQSVLEEKLAFLEGGESCVVTGSGMAAVASCLLTALRPGDHVISSPVIYGNSHSLLGEYLTDFGVEADFIDLSDLEQLKAAIRPNTKMVYLESPGNPLCNICDIEAICTIAHGANKEIRVVCDNTFATPYNQNPLALGADVVIHSVTKYINGHGDVIAGAVIGKADFIKKVREDALLHMTGAAIGAMESYQILRGMKTFELRMLRHNENALAVAQFLENHPKVRKVYYPGLESFPGHETACRQMRGFGGMLAFELKGGVAAGKQMLKACDLCAVAVSLGDADTLIAHGTTMTHDDCSEELLKTIGITPDLIRMSIGIENKEDIIADLAQALDQVTAG